MRFSASILCAGVLWSAAPAAVSANPQGTPAIDYQRDIRPILSNHCYACHGPDQTTRKAGLRLDDRSGAFKELKSGNVALVGGHRSKSELWARITSTTAREQMPPKSTGKPLSKQQIELLGKWIDQGAKWDAHWAYVPAKRPALPAVQKRGWLRNDIDAFILHRLEAVGWKPSPEADRITLIRRVTLDLTGLPPTLAEIDAFVNDRSADAYEKVVDRLLASPHYGERMAQHWLDLARYADTNGYHIDNHRDVWKYRDWVIGAFNRNLSFRQFTIEQLAGDLLPNATLEQKIASGFHRNHGVNFEGGADPNEYQTKYVIDRVTTTATVFLGTTLACAECHNHKYDPFTQKDFYRFYAFFNNVPERGLDGQKDNPVPSIRVASPDELKKLDATRKQIAELEKRIQTELAQVKIEESKDIKPTQPEPREVVWVDDALPPGALPQGHEGANSWRWVTEPGHPVFSGKKSHQRTAAGLSQHFFTGASPALQVGAGDTFFTYVYLDPRNPPKQIMLQFNDGTWEHRAYWGDNVIDWGADNTASRRKLGPLPAAGKWVRLEVEAQLVGLNAGAAVNGIAFTQFDGTVYWDKTGLLTRGPSAAPLFDSQVAWELRERGNAQSKLPKDVLSALKKDAAQRSDAQKKLLRDHFSRFVYSGTRKLFDPLNGDLDELKKTETALQDAIPAAMVMEEMKQPRDTFILMRGDFRVKGEKVTPGVPESLPPLPKDAPANRLGLAQWLTDPAHPLTSRVTVNRLWALFLGTGLVKTSDDFGSQGELPSHPELLDWLAAEFMAPSPPTPLPQGARGEMGWDVKALVRKIVTSATYRQTSVATKDQQESDPHNRLMGRGPRFRLDGETIRDNALAVGGLLNRKVGGPSVRPYQPAGLWEQVAFGGGFSSQTYVQSKGSDLYRRGLYVYWKRSLPYPSLVAFDAPNREVCVDQRPRTNTPLQALVLLNDPVFVEAARNLGQRILKEGPADTAGRLTFAFRLTTARPPAPREVEVLTRIYEKQLATYKADPKAALALVSVGESPRPADLNVSELAAWTAVGNVLLNLDETITRR